MGSIPGEGAAATQHSARLLELCKACHEEGAVLVTSIPAADVILIPRNPDAAVRDGLFFIAYATNVKAVQLCERLRQERRVALVLDIDNTLIDSASVDTATSKEWATTLQWIPTDVTNSSGKHILGEYALVPGEDPTCEACYAIRWHMGTRLVLFKVRVRKGWNQLYQYLASNKSKYLVSVCSKGKAEYVQLIWTFLDPGNRLIPKNAWVTRVNSTFPDTLPRAAPKTALLALGCITPNQPVLPTQLAAPLMCLDDSSDAYSHEYLNSVMFVEEYRPSEGLSDSGTVLVAVCSALDGFWTSACGSEGTFAWQAAQSFATAILGASQRMAMESADSLVYLQTRCRKQGELLHRQITVEAIFGHRPVIVDRVEAKNVDTFGLCVITPERAAAIAADNVSAEENNNFEGAHSPRTAGSLAGERLAARYIPLKGPLRQLVRTTSNGSDEFMSDGFNSNPASPGSPNLLSLAVSPEETILGTSPPSLSPNKLSFGS